PAIKKLQQALALAKSLADTRAEADTLHQLGRAEARAGDEPWTGLRRMIDALELRQRIRDALGEAQSFRRIGELLAANDQGQLALRLMIVSHYLYEALGNSKIASDVALALEKLAEDLDIPDLDRLSAGVKQEYLSDRGERLLLAISEQIPPGV